MLTRPPFRTGDDEEAIIEVLRTENAADYLKDRQTEQVVDDIQDSTMDGAAENQHDRQRIECESAVRAVFPDICPDFLRTKVKEHECNSEVIVASIVDDMDNGRPYPKRKLLKRKRESEVDNNSPDQVEAEAKRSKWVSLGGNFKNDVSYSRRYVKEA
jgi:hypothetical protein